jgi:maleate isomerase
LSLPFETDHGLGHRAILGLIVLQADETIEPEFRSFAGFDGVSLYHSRIASDPEVTAETLARMEAEIPAAVRLLPLAPSFDVIGYACTSGATIIGPEKVARAIHTVRPGVATTDPLSAVKAAVRSLQVTRIGFVTPYIAEVSEAMRRNLETSGLRITAFGSFEQSEEHVVAQIAPDSVFDAILDIGGSDECDAVFVSCTNLRSLAVIEAVEAKLGKPVLSSNQAIAWHMIRLAGVTDRPDGLGALFRQALA